MSRKTRRLVSASAAALCFALAGFISSVADAASISYGNFGPVPPGVVMFLDVTESSGTDAVPIYGPPSAFPNGLDFDPTSFVASGTGGSADITDGQLNFTIMSPVPIVRVRLSEAGDYTLAGIGTAATSVNASASLRVTEINGVPVPHILSNASVGFNLTANPGVLQPWTLGTSLNIPGQLGATKVKVVIDNSLLALSEPGSVAFIAKKDFRIDTEVIPEPATMALAGMALCGLGLATRKRS